MNLINSYGQPSIYIPPVPRRAIWIAITALFVLFAPTHAQHPALSLARSAAAVKSRPLPFEAKLAPGTFLVASRRLRDPNFAQTVILLIAYDEKGAQDVVINRPSPIRVSRVLPELPTSKTPSPYIYLGGPVAQNQLRILVQTDEPSEGMQHVLNNVYLSGNPEVLKQLLERNGPALRFRTFAGYSGWAPGQLEQEIERGGWHIFHADVDAMFDPAPNTVWPRLIRKRDLKWM